MPNLISRNPAHNHKLQVFAERCEARALLWASGQLSLHDAVDKLQFDAVRTGLVRELGQDEIQRIMAEAFEKRRIRL